MSGIQFGVVETYVSSEYELPYSFIDSVTFSDAIWDGSMCLEDLMDAQADYEPEEGEAEEIKGFLDWLKDYYDEHGFDKADSVTVVRVG